MRSLELGFKSKPLDLTEVLEKQGFKLEETIKAVGDDPEIRTYLWFDEQRSQRGVHITYSDGINKDEEDELLRLEPNLVAQVDITTYSGRNKFDANKQEEVMRFLKNYYNAVLYDPNEKAAFVFKSFVNELKSVLEEEEKRRAQCTK